MFFMILDYVKYSPKNIYMYQNLAPSSSSLSLKSLPSPKKPPSLHGVFAPRNIAQLLQQVLQPRTAQSGHSLLRKLPDVALLTLWLALASDGENQGKPLGK